MSTRARTHLALTVILMTTASAAPSQEPFRPVQGASLPSKLAEAAQRAAIEAPGKSFWTAYSFDLRPGIAFGVEPMSAFQGKAEILAGTQILYGTLNGAPVSSRVALFALHPPKSAPVSKVAIFNLDERQRPADDHPVYWLGHASKDEAFTNALWLAESGQSTAVRAPATLAVALQGDLRVSEALQRIVNKSPDAEARSIALASLGQLKTASEFLSDVARQSASSQTQIQAIQAVARDRSGDTVARLRGIYRPGLPTDVKMALINAITNGRDKDGRDKAAIASFLLDLEQQDPAPEIREHAVFMLRTFDSDAVVDELMSRFQSKQDEDAKNQILYAFSQMRTPRSLEKLVEIARHDASPGIRRGARYWIQDRIGQRLAQQLPRGGTKTDPFEAEAERIMREQSPTEAVTTFIRITRTNPDPRVRQRAVFYLSKLDDPRVVDFYLELLPR